MADTDGSVKIGVALDTSDVITDIRDLVAEINKTLKRIETNSALNKPFDSAKKSIDSMQTSINNANTSMSDLQSTTNNAFDTDNFKTVVSMMSQMQTSFKEVIYYLMQINHNIQQSNQYTNLFKATVEQLGYDLNDVNSKVSSLDETTAQLLNRSDNDTLSRPYRNAKNNVKSFVNALADADSEQSDFLSNAKRMELVSHIWNNIKENVLKLPSAFRKAGNAIKNIFRGIKDGAKSSEKSMSRLLKSMIKYVLGFRSLYFLVRKIKQYGAEALQALALESEKVNSDMSRLLTSFSQLKYSLASFIQPVLSIAVPALEKLAAAGVRASEALGKVFAVLAGQNYIYKANKVQRDYAESLQKTAKAAKEAKKQLGEYDKLKVIQKNDNTGADSGIGDTGLGDLFSKEKFDTSKYEKFLDKIKDMWKKADFTDLGFQLAESIRKTLDQIPWEEIRETAGKVGKSIATFLNGIFLDKNFAKTLGTTIGNAINTALDFAFNFVHNFNWDSAGRWLATYFNNLFATIDWSEAGRTLYEGLAGVLDFLIAYMQEMDWQTVGQNIGNFTKEIKIGKLALKLAELLWEIVKAGVQLFIGMFQTNPLDTALLTIFGVLHLTGLDVIIATALRNAITAAIAKLGAGSVAVGGLGLGAAIVAIVAGALAIINWQELFAMDLEPGELSNALLEFFFGDTIQFANDTKKIFTSMFNNFIAFAKDLAEGKFDKALEDFKGFGRDLIDGLCSGLILALSLIGEPIRKLFFAVVDLFKDLFGIHSPSTVFASFGTMLIQGLINGIASMTGKLLNTFKSIFDKILNMVSNFTSGFKKGFETVKTATKSVANSTIGVFNKLIDLAQGGINSIGDGFSKFKIDVPDWVPGIGGKKYNFSLPKINLKKIPALAEGAVIPPNKKFLAQLGDQKHGTNIEAPLETIKQALQEVLSGTVNSDATIDLTVNLDGTVIYNRLVEIDRKKIKQSGKSGFGGVR